MITAILSLLGIGGIAGLGLRLFAPGLIGKGLALLDRLPKWLVYGLAGLLALALAWLWHGHVVKVAYREAFKAGEVAAGAKWQKSFDTMKRASDQWRSNYEAVSSRLSDQLRNTHEQDLRDNARLADALGLHGPGRAAAPRCGSGSDPELRTAAGGREPGPAGPGAPPGPMPAGDGFAIVPWSWTVRQAREHDDLLDEVKTWRTWHREQKALHDKAVADLRARLDAVKVLPPPP